MAGRRDNRERLYQALKAAGADGISSAELGEQGITGIAAHAESLIMEGHALEHRKIEPPGGGTPIPTGRWFLLKDAWADGECAPP